MKYGTCIVAWYNFDNWISALRDNNINLCFLFTSTTRICAPLTTGTVGLAGSYFKIVVVFLPGTPSCTKFLWNRFDRNLRLIVSSIRELNFDLFDVFIFGDFNLNIRSGISANVNHDYVGFFWVDVGIDALRVTIDYLDDFFDTCRDCHIEYNFFLSSMLNDQIFSISAFCFALMFDADFLKFAIIVVFGFQNGNIFRDYLNNISLNRYQGLARLIDMSNCWCVTGCILYDVDWISCVVVIILYDFNFGIFLCKRIDHNWLFFHIINEHYLFACLVSDHFNNNGLIRLINKVFVFIVWIFYLDNNWRGSTNINIENVLWLSSVLCGSRWQDVVDSGMIVTSRA